MGKIDFSRSAEEIDRLIRGLNPWPSAYTFYKGKTLKIWEAFPVQESADGEPGSIQRTEKDAVYINTGNGVLKVTQLQLEGKKRMLVRDFLLGCRIEKGEMLGMLGYGYYFDPTYFLVIIGAVLSIWASARVNNTFSKYSRVRSMTGMTGAEAAG